MQKHVNISEVNLAEDYRKYLQSIGELFMHSFNCRWQTLPLQIQIVCGGMTISAFRDLLIKKPHLVNIRDDFGRVMLMLDYHTIYKVLLGCGADPNAKDYVGNSVLVYQRRDSEAVKALIKAGADVNAKNNAGVPVINFFFEDELPIQPLLDAGAVMPRNPPRKRLHFNPNDEFGQINSSTGVNLCSNLNSIVTRDGVKNISELESLLKAGADPNQGKEWKNNTDEETLLYRAVCSHDSRAVKLLLDHGADPNTGTTYMDADDTCVARAVRDNELEILRLLIKAKADLNFAIRCDRTPIRTAISVDNLPALKMLIKGGADPCLADPFGVPPIKFLKEENNSPELCKYFKAVVARHKKKVADPPKT